ncbi:hypothetical protein diail_3813 [Diaporthe ilicicola]|nr:hypothetical protein diail_3813 [Diaporthe ilicicola]
MSPIITKPPTRGNEARTPLPSVDDLLPTHWRLFRRRKASHFTHPPPPCLRCAIKGMHCKRPGGDVRCQRCVRNGDEVCVLQKEDLTRPEEEEEESGGGGERDGPGQSEIAARPRRGRRRPAELTCIVYCLDPVVQRDRRRLLGIAAGMLAEGTGATHVHGTRVSWADARNFALPLWHGNDKDENKRDWTYNVETNQTYLDKIRLGRVEKIKVLREAEERRLAGQTQNEVGPAGLETVSEEVEQGPVSKDR